MLVRKMCGVRGKVRFVSTDAHETLKKYLHRDNIEKLKPNTWLDIQFPFSLRWAPKGFLHHRAIDETNTLKFLLTEQRLKHLLEVHQLTTMSNRPSGLVYAGPHGLGKSAVNYHSFFLVIHLIFFLFCRNLY